MLGFVWVMTLIYKLLKIYDNINITLSIIIIIERVVIDAARTIYNEEWGGVGRRGCKTYAIYTRVGGGGGGPGQETA